MVPDAAISLLGGDGLLLVADSRPRWPKPRRALGRLEPGRLVKDRADLDYIRVFVGKAGMVGMPLAELPLPKDVPVHILHVRRYDMDLVPSPDLELEFGDRVGVLVPPERQARRCASTLATP